MTRPISLRVEVRAQGNRHRKEETFNFTKVYKHGQDEQEYAWFIQHFSLLGSDGVIPAGKKAIPRHYSFINGKYYESMTAFGFVRQSESDLP